VALTTRPAFKQHAATCAGRLVNVTVGSRSAAIILMARMSGVVRPATRPGSNASLSLSAAARYDDDRSLAELVVYLTRRYRQPTQRMEAIAAVLPDFVPSCLQRRAAFHRLASVFTSLCEAMETHVWLVDQILSPAIIRAQARVRRVRRGRRRSYQLARARGRGLAGLAPEHARAPADGAA
jgi:hypothetical protein